SASTSETDSGVATDLRRPFRVESMIGKSGTGFPKRSCSNEREHDPEKWVPVFRKDHAQTKKVAARRLFDRRGISLIKLRRLRPRIRTKRVLESDEWPARQRRCR